MNKLIERSWLSPVVSIAFAVIAITGLLLFFHIKNGSIVTLHEWAGWGFVIAGLVHVLLNWNLLVSYLKRRSALIAIGISLLMVVGLTVAGAAKRHGGPRSASTPAIVGALDANRDGTLQNEEVTNAVAAIMRLDRDGDAQISPSELQPRNSARPGHQH
jgi:hypothetical protein